MKAETRTLLQLEANLIENTLRRETVLASLEKQVADRTKDLTALFDFTMQTSQAETVTDMLEPAIRHIADITYCQAICVHLFSSDQRALRLTVQLGLPETALPSLQEIPASPAVTELLKYTEKQALLAEQPNLPSILPSVFNLSDFQMYLGSQSRVQGRPIGFFSAYRVEKRPFDLNEISLLVILASLPDIELLDTAHGSLTAYQTVLEKQPHLLIIDDSLPADEAQALVTIIRAKAFTPFCIWVVSTARQKKLGSVNVADTSASTEKHGTSPETQ